MIYLKVKEACQKKKISIRKLESDLGFSTGSVCKWKKSQPSFDKTVKVADYLGISLEELRSKGVKK